MYIQNTTERLLHVAYKIPAAPDAPAVGRYLAIDENTPGILPGSHDIDPDTAKLVREHPTNAIFFDTGMLKICEGSAPKGEQNHEPRKGPPIFRADARALATVQASKGKSRA